MGSQALTRCLSPHAPGGLPADRDDKHAFSHRRATRGSHGESAAPHEGAANALSGLAAALQAALDVDLPRAITTLSPRAIGDPREDRLTLVGGSELHVLNCVRCEEVALLPSRWLRRRVAVALAPGRLGVAMGCGPALRTELALAEVPAVTSALGDERRFEILRLCIQRPRTTSELAPILGITEGPVSRHLNEGARTRRAGDGRATRAGSALLGRGRDGSLLGLRLQRLTQHVWAERAPNAAGEPRAA